MTEFFYWFTYSKYTYRDDPLEMPSFVAMNEAKLDGKIISLGDNLFSAIK